MTNHTYPNEADELDSPRLSSSPPASRAGRRGRRWLTAAGATVTVVAIATTSIYLAERSGAESAYTDAQQRLTSAIKAKKTADASLTAELESAKRSAQDWTPARLRDLPRVVSKQDADAVAKAVHALSTAAEHARKSASPATDPPKKKQPGSSPGALRTAAATATEERTAVTKQVAQLERADRSVEAAASKLDDAVAAAAKTVSKKTSEWLGKYSKATAKVRSEFQSRMKAASTAPCPQRFAVASAGLTVLQRSHEAAVAEEAAAAAANAGTVQTSALGQAVSPGGPTSGGTAGASGSWGTSGGGSTPSTGGGWSAPSGGSAGSGSTGGGSRPANPRPGGGGGGGGGVTKPNPPAPCRVIVIPQKSGAPSGPGTSGSQSGSVGGCTGTVTVTPGIPSNANATTSTSGSSWSVHWSVPMPSDW